MDLKNIEYKKLKKYVPILLILIVIIISSHYRLYPSKLPVTDKWAKNTIDNSVQNQILNDIYTNYPGLPQDKANELVAQQFNTVITENKAEYNNQIKILSNEFKKKMKDDYGYTYLLGIDAYYWYTQTKNIVETGHAWDKIVDGEHRLSVRNGRFGKFQAFNLHPYIQAYMYKFMHFFNRNLQIMHAVYYTPVILIALSVIIVFLIGKKISGNLGGFSAAMILALNASLLSRTPAGFSDTDGYNILMPLLAMWLFFLSMDDRKFSWLYSLLAGISIVAYTTIWPGAWHIIAVIYTCSGLMFIYLFFKDRISIKKHLKNIGIFFASTFIPISLYKGIHSYINVIFNPINSLKIKEVATKTIWPNVMTTVAEFNVGRYWKIINEMGGNLVFLFAVAGLVLLLIYEWKKPKYSFFIIPWFLITMVPYTQGVRFAILLVPAFAIAFGIAADTIYRKLSGASETQLHIPKYLSIPTTLVLIGLMFIPIISDAKEIMENELPIINDAWYNSLDTIKNDAGEENAIITSWWDYGHWFYSITGKSTTFDGANQGKRIHWVGKTLLTNNEDEAISILKMLNCGQEKATANMTALYGNEYDGVKKLYELLEGREPTGEEKPIYDKYINCDDLWIQYYIVSEDMIGKAGVWGHFGSWDFDRAQMYIKVSMMSSIDGPNYLMNNWNMSKEEAEQIYYEIKNTKADKWVSPWPGYYDSVKCYDDNSTIYCSEIKIDKENMTVDGLKPESMSYLDNGTFNVKYFNDTSGYSLILYEYDGRYNVFIADPLDVASMFTRLFFFNGIGLEHFKLLSHKVAFNGEDIFVYKVNFDGID